jgi:hypothetical protein
LGGGTAFITRPHRPEVRDDRTRRPGASIGAIPAAPRRPARWPRRAGPRGGHLAHLPDGAAPQPALGRVRRCVSIDALRDGHLDMSAQPVDQTPVLRRQQQLDLRGDHDRRAPFDERAPDNLVCLHLIGGHERDLSRIPETIVAERRVHRQLVGPIGDRAHRVRASRAPVAPGFHRIRADSSGVTLALASQFWLYNAPGRKPS